VFYYLNHSYSNMEITGQTFLEHMPKYTQLSKSNHGKAPLVEQNKSNSSQ